MEVPTCWKESSKSVCRETLIFTWLGSAFDWRKTRERAQPGPAGLLPRVTSSAGSRWRVAMPIPTLGTSRPLAQRCAWPPQTHPVACTHVTQEAELVVLPAKAAVVSPRRAPLLAPAMASAGAFTQVPPHQHTPQPTRGLAPSPARARPACQPGLGGETRRPSQEGGTHPDSNPGRGSLNVVVRVL